MILLALLTVTFGAMVAVFMMTDSPIAAFATLAVGAPIASAASWFRTSGAQPKTREANS